ncbi:MAG: imidazole glycerol phosphate synthase subunit HisH, partial [Methanobrevibacter sp.]|nr:imidazole glycerol phosphate synthase subunit HisH [Methanobrevibacter sp.]
GVDGKDFYFVHSYHAVLDDIDNLSATADYGFDVTAAVSKDNVFATQFHPEKSGVPGLKILKNFVNLE